MRKQFIFFLIGMSILALAGCVQETYLRKVNFAIDMRNVEDVQSVGIRGNFAPLSWDADTLMNDPDSNQIYTASITFDTPFDFMECKFVLNGEVFELDGKDNRKVYFEGKDEVDYEVVFDVE